MRGVGDTLDVYLVRRRGSGCNCRDIPGLSRYCALNRPPIGAVEDKQQTFPGVQRPVLPVGKDDLAVASCTIGEDVTAYLPGRDVQQLANVPAHEGVDGIGTVVQSYSVERCYIHRIAIHRSDWLVVERKGSEHPHVDPRLPIRNDHSVGDELLPHQVAALPLGWGYHHCDLDRPG